MKSNDLKTPEWAPREEENIVNHVQQSKGERIRDKFSFRMKSEKRPGEKIGVRVEPVKKRYLILMIFVILNVIKSFQWICLASITNVIAHFYQVDNTAVNWTTVIFMVTFLSLCLPVSYLMNFIGLRKSVIIGALGVTLGVIIKCFSCHRDGFLLNFVGHVIIGFAEPFFFSIYSQLASVWFPDDQVSLATSIGVLGDQLGIALGFIIPGLMVGNDPYDLETVQTGLYRLSHAIAMIASVNSLLVLIFFDEQPAFAPGLGRLEQMKHQELQAEEQRRWPLKQRLCKPVSDLKDLITDKNFINLLLSFGINVGTNYSLHTVLNQMLLSPFIIEANNPPQLATPTANTSSYVSVSSSEMQAELNLLANNHQTVGDAGLLLILSGLFGLVFFGHLLDRLHRYKLITVACYALSLVWMLIFTGGLYLKKELVIYILSVPLGFFITAYTGCGFEYGTELTYPRSELLTSTLLNMSAQMFGIPITFGASYMADFYGSLSAGLFLALMLLIGLILNCIQGGELVRQKSVASQQQAGIPASGASTC